MIEVLSLISLVAAVVLILRKSGVGPSAKLLWCVIALVAFDMPNWIIYLVDSVAPGWPMRPILAVLIVISEFLIPWVVFAIYNEKTDPAHGGGNAA